MTTGPVLRATHPLFSVDGADAPGLARDLLRLEVCHPRDGLVSFEATFSNWGPGDAAGTPAGFRYFDGRVLGLGRRIRVLVGDPGAESLVFAGTITAIVGRYDEARSPEVVVRAEDALWTLRMTQRSRVSAGSTDGDVVTRIATDAGLRPDVGADGVSHAQHWQVNQSDLAQLRERARAADAALVLDDETLAFAAVDADEQEPVELSRLAELLHAEVTADLAHQRSEVHVHGWSVADKAAIHGVADRSVVDAVSSGGKVGPGVLEDIGLTAVQHEHGEMPATVDEARQLARAFLLRRARRFVTARATTLGNPELRVGRKVKLLDLGDWFTGTYRVAELRHTWDTRVGFRTHFVAERVSIGGGT